MKHPMKQLLILLSMLLVPSLTWQMHIKGQCFGVSESDSLQLVGLFQSLEGASWTNGDSWLVGPVIEWFGVEVTEDECQVSGIWLIDQGLVGVIPDLQLPALEELRLDNNEGIYGDLPNFSGLPSLKILNLQNADLLASVPDFQNLPNLLDLILSNNQNLGGSLIDFTAMPNLRELRLKNTGISGEIPNYSNLPNLQWLDLSDNSLTGEVPLFEACPLLTQLNLSGNQLTGLVPNYSGTNLHVLDLRQNELIGPIPDFDLPELQRLFLGNNQLMGNIPNTFFPKLVILDLGYNQLEGPLPEIHLNCPLIYDLNLSGNPIGGQVPDLSLFPNLQSLSLAECNLVGTIPSLDQPELRLVDLGFNHLTGPIPAFNNIIEWLILRGNQLTGVIPDFTGTNLTLLMLCPNSLKAPIPAAEQFSQMGFGVYELIDFSCVEGVKLSGYAYRDDNENCIFDDWETSLSGIKVYNGDQNYYVVSGPDGYYEMLQGLGEYNLYPQLPNELWDYSCAAQLPLNIVGDSFDQSFNNLNLGLVATESCAQMNVEVWTPVPRNCTEIPFHISYCNLGTSLAENAYIDLNFSAIDNYFIEQDHEELSEGEIRIFLGDVAVGSCEEIVMSITISCAVPVGATFCCFANIGPVNDCGGFPAVWDGSDIEVEAECTGDEVSFTITNVGESMDSPNVYRCYEDDLLANIATYQLQSGESTAYETTANGNTHRIKVFCNEGNPFNDYVQRAVESCGTEPFSLGFAGSSQYSDLSGFRDIFCEEIIGSFDPNDKGVMPRGVAAEKFVLPSQELEYRIRFQNTGNDTAFWVKLVDTIDMQILDLSSIRTISGSHPYHFELIDNVASWTFENILLPDSTTDEQGSQGYVEFLIEQLPDNENGATIENFADIYFDNNVPVRTNTTFNTVCDDFDFGDLTALVGLNTAFLDEEQIIEGASTFLNSEFSLASEWIAFNTVDINQVGDSIDVFFTFENESIACNPLDAVAVETVLIEDLSAGLYSIFVRHNLTTDTTATKLTLKVDPPVSNSSLHASAAQIFPNPFDDHLLIEASGAGPASLEVRDIHGKLIYQSTITGQQKIETTAWKSGIYFISLTNEERLICRRFIRR